MLKAARYLSRTVGSMNAANPRSCSSFVIGADGSREVAALYLVAFSVALAVGVTFGYYPAHLRLCSIR